MDLIAHAKKSFELAERGKSKLSSDVLQLKGMSGAYTRHFYNNLCSIPGIRYLEIGSWAGSTLASAMYNNSAECVAIDNWSEFGGPRQDFLHVLKTYRGANNVTFHESDCWSPTLIDSLRDKRFQIYLYDGHHGEQSHYDALTKYLPCMDDTFLFIVDDWNAPEVRNGTERALKDTGVQILWQNRVRLTWDDTHTPMDLAGRTWWNGIAVFVLSK